MLYVWSGLLIAHVAALDPYNHCWSTCFVLGWMCTLRTLRNLSRPAGEELGDLDHDLSVPRLCQKKKTKKTVPSANARR